MSYRLQISPAAHNDVEGAAQYIQEYNPDAAERFVDAVEATYRDILSSPMRWPLYPLSNPRLAGVRKRPVIGFRKYQIFYRVEKRTVGIIRVLHGARDIPSVLSDSVEFREE